MTTDLIPHPPQPLAPFITEQQMHELHALIEAVIECAQPPLDMLRAIGGPNMQGEAQQAFATMNLGTAHFRAVRDRIQQLYRVRNAARKNYEEDEPIDEDLSSPSAPVAGVDRPAGSGARHDAQCVDHPSFFGGENDRLECEPANPAVGGGAPAESSELVAGAPPCQVGTSIYAQHKLDIKLRCTRCGWQAKGAL